MFFKRLEVGIENIGQLEAMELSVGLCRDMGHSHGGFCLNFSSLLHSAALKYEVPKERGRLIRGRSGFG